MLPLNKGKAKSNMAKKKSTKEQNTKDVPDLILGYS